MIDVAELMKLVEKWRQNAVHYDRGDYHGGEDYTDCADELEALLARAEEPEQAARERLEEQLAERNARVLYLEGLINTPRVDEFIDAVRFEAAHQVERWGTQHDAGKGPSDWFWLLGYLGGKALNAANSGDVEKAKHHTISSAAMLLNWFKSLTGDATAMRPGIEPPTDRAEGKEPT